MNNKTIIGGGVGVLLIGGVFFGTAYFFPTASDETVSMEQKDNKETTVAPALSDLPIDTDKLYTNDIVVGNGKTAESGDLITVHYVGLLTDGTVFDSSESHGQPFSFVLGGGQVIKGWDQGVVGMKVGGKRVLVIPADLAYGNQVIGPIPANSTLVFEVDLLSAVDTQ